MSNGIPEKKDKPPENPAEPQRQTPPATAHEDARQKEVERRLNSVEESLTELRRNQIEGHKWFITVIFSLVALLLALLGISSKSDVREAIRDMKSDAHDTTTDMEKRFQALAGESLKKPAVELLNENLPLEGQLIELNAPANMYPIEAAFSTLFVKNVGDKRTEPLSIRLALEPPIGLAYARPQEWESSASYEKDFASSFYSTRHDTVAPGETLNVHPLIFGIAPQDAAKFSQTNILCKLQVFYGGERPAESQFRIRFMLK